MKDRDSTNPIDDDVTDDISKSQRKRDAHALLESARKIVTLPPQQLQKLQLTPGLADAIYTARKMRNANALKRQIKYIGKLMRETNAERIHEQLAIVDATSERNKHRHHRLERYAERLIAGERDCLDEIIAEYPALDRQRLRQLIRAAQREQSQQAPLKSRRLLFRFLRELDEQQQLEQAHANADASKQ